MRAAAWRRPAETSRKLATTGSNQIENRPSFKVVTPGVVVGPTPEAPLGDDLVALRAPLARVTLVLRFGVDADSEAPLGEEAQDFNLRQVQEPST